MAWTDEKMAHVDTWFTLFRTNQILAPFPDAGKIKMSELTFYNPAASRDHLKIEATLIANTVDQLFSAFGVKLENNISRNGALSAMIEVLMDDSKTIEDLAEANDTNYLFVNEKKPVV
ncbi:hypothetical protein [Dyadobacter sp. CY351]|uniref:hypothetical protein n=1 Tax=Dyadobacter sp. CY351 TaxID=2909337 RepID=UPI001F40491B|nr:hypothetical protein [Dyadobacter sp. CY351]MCF2518544.1 hypothetical protein [Dyadobacter sp. CY351]